MQDIYIKNKEYFDEVIIYCGEDSNFDYSSLCIQYEKVIEKRRKIEKILNDQKYIELPYNGLNPYIFVSYSHRDKDRVFPILSLLQRNSVRTWYDDGIQGGNNWRTQSG